MEVDLIEYAFEISDVLHGDYLPIATSADSRTQPSAPRYGLRGVGCLKQMPNAVFQQFGSPLQGAELSDSHYRDGQAQVK